MTNRKPIITREQWGMIKEVILGERTDLGITITAGCRHAGCTRAEFNALLRRSREGRVDDEVWVADVAATMDDKEQVRSRRGDVFMDEMVIGAMQGFPETTSVNGVVVRETLNRNMKYLERLALHFNPELRPKVQDIEADPKRAADDKLNKTFDTPEEAHDAMVRLRNYYEANRSDDQEV